MSIDWSEVLEKPEKVFKVPGQMLLQQRNKIESLQKTVDELKAGKTDADQKLASLNLRIETVLGDLESKKAKNVEFEKSIDNLKEVIAGLEDNLASSDDKQKQMAAQIAELEGAVNSKDAQIAEQTNKVAELEAKLSELSQTQSKVEALEQQVSEISVLQGKLSEKDSEITALNTKMSEMEGKIAGSDTDKNELEKGLQQKIKLLEEEKGSFEEQYKLKEAEVKDKEEKVSSLQGKVQELETKLKPPAPIKPAGDLGKAKTGIKSQIPWKSGTGVFVCSDCGSNRSEDVTDKSKILYVAAGTPIYAKKKRCLNCGAEWNID